MFAQDIETFTGKSVVSVGDLSRQQMLQVLALAKRFKESPVDLLLGGKILGSCFFEASTRTRLSFEAAMLGLGGQVIGFSDGQITSVSKGESLSDTIATVSQYVDVIVIRHPMEGSSRLAADVAGVPVINAGDGSNEHPSQTLLDLFSIQECQGRLHELNIAMVGDLKHGRTVHSLAEALGHFDVRLYFVSPESLEMPPTICHELSRKAVKFSFHRDVEEIIDRIDVLYMTRVQQERFSDPLECQEMMRSYRVTLETLRFAKKNLRVFHPMPRIGEIAKEVDKSPAAYYFTQVKNGKFVRQALLALLLGGACDDSI